MAVSVMSQQGNPFELEHKVPEGQKWKGQAEVDLPTAVKNQDTLEQTRKTEAESTLQLQSIEGNPFEINSSPSAEDRNVNKSSPSGAGLEQVSKPNTASPLKETVYKNPSEAKISQFKIILVVMLLVALALISTLLRHVIIKVFESFQSDNLLRGYFRSIGRRVGFPNLLLELFFVLNAAFSIFLIMEFYDSIGSSPLITFFQIFMATGIVVFGKHLVLYIIQEIFPVQKQASEYNFTINVFFSILGLILLPCNLILAFAPPAMAKLGLYLMAIATSLVVGYLTVRAFLIGSKFLSSNRFHFFMYLCAVELAPMLIVIKVIKNFMGS